MSVITKKKSRKEVKKYDFVENPDYAKKHGWDKGFTLYGVYYPPGYGIKWTRFTCEGNRVSWVKPHPWRGRVAEAGEKAEKQIKAAGEKGLPFEEFTGDLNRLGEMIRQGTVKVPEDPGE